MASAHHIFDRARVKKHRERAAKNPAAHDFLLREMAERLCDRLPDINRHFPLALDLGSHHGIIAETLAGRGGIETLVQMDFSPAMAAQAKSLALAGDEELLPFAQNTFDLVISSGSLHWVNDLPGTLIQIRQVLEPDGLFIAVMPGGETLRELRDSFEKAEMQVSGGLSPRVSPFIDVRDGGALLQRAGFALPVADSEMVTVAYDHPLKLLHDLKGMGQSNALMESAKGMMPCSLLMLAVDHYLRNHMKEDKIHASVELVTLTGWKPHDSQQQPAKRGSGKLSLKGALEN